MPKFELAGPELTTLQIYLRELVLPVRIGVFSHERERPQDVRFDVNVEVEAPAHGPKQLEDTLSYDLIRDLVSTVIAEGHVELAEASGSPPP